MDTQDPREALREALRKAVQDALQGAETEMTQAQVEGMVSDMMEVAEAVLSERALSYGTSPYTATLLTRAGWLLSYPRVGPQRAYRRSGRLQYQPQNML